MVNHIYNCYKKAWLNAFPNGQFEILKEKFSDEETQKATRGIGAKKDDFEYWSKKDIESLIGFTKLQIKVECDYEYNSYLIYLNFV